jgi:hypothetical protein
VLVQGPIYCGLLEEHLDVGKHLTQPCLDDAHRQLATAIAAEGAHERALVSRAHWSA